MHCDLGQYNKLGLNWLGISRQCDFGAFKQFKNFGFWFKTKTI